MKVLRSNRMKHCLITGHWCILLTNVRSPTDVENGNQDTDCNLTSVNRCVEVEHLEESINQGTLMYSQKLSMARETATDDCKSQGTQHDSRFQSQNKWSEVDGMESAGRRELRHPPSTNTRYSETLYNVEGLNKDVHMPIIVSGMADMQSQDN